MRKAVLLLLMLPSICFGQAEKFHGKYFTEFKGEQTGLSAESIYVSFRKNPHSIPIEKFRPDAYAVSEDFYFRFVKSTRSISVFAFGESAEVAIALRKANVKSVAATEKKAEPVDAEKINKDNEVVVEKTSGIATNKTGKDESNPGEKKAIDPPVVSQVPPAAGRETTSGNLPHVDPPAEKKATEVRAPENLPGYHALIIGVSNYKYAGPGLGNLQRPVLDAAKLSETLATHYSFLTANVHLLLDATRADIIDELENLAAKLTEKDNLIIFFAGHGYWDENLEIGYWLPSDAMLSKKSSWIMNSTIKDYVGGLKTKHTLLISDACFSGSIFKVREVEPLSELGVSKLYQLPSRKAMTSGNMKTVPDKSKFFEFFNKRLQENEDKYLSARQLFQNFYVAVINNTNTVPQYGVIQETGDEGGEFIFIRK